MISLFLKKQYLQHPIEGIIVAAFGIFFLGFFQFLSAQNGPELPEVLIELENKSRNYGLILELSVTPEYSTFEKGDQIRYQLKSNQPCYVTLLSFQADGSWLILFPNQFESDTFVGSEEIKWIPAPENESYQLIVDEPYGSEIVCAVASTSEVELAQKIRKLMQQQEQYVALSRGVFPISTSENNLKLNAGHFWDIAWIQIKTTESKQKAPIPMLPRPYAIIVILLGILMIAIALWTQRPLARISH